MGDNAEITKIYTFNFCLQIFFFRGVNAGRAHISRPEDGLKPNGLGM
jgi:hypothetical protein